MVPSSLPDSAGWGEGSISINKLHRTATLPLNLALGDRANINIGNNFKDSLQPNMSKNQSIKDLVIESYVNEGNMPSFESLTHKVRDQFPSSKWQKTHYSWYKSQIKTGKIIIPASGDFPEESSEQTSEEADIQQSEMQVSLESDLQQYLSFHIEEIEKGLNLVDDGIEYVTDAGRIDLLAKDSNDDLVVIELKAVKAKDSALGQLLGYIGVLSESNKNVRGILVASDFDKRVVYAAKALPNIKLVKYQLSFKLGEVT